MGHSVAELAPSAAKSVNKSLLLTDFAADGASSATECPN